jgi:hypothetical protein
MTLLDYANARECVVLDYAAHVAPNVVELPLGHPDFDDQSGPFDDLAGVIDADGAWQWDGRDSPRDPNRNTIARMTARPLPERWRELTNEPTPRD